MSETQLLVDLANERARRLAAETERDEMQAERDRLAADLEAVRRVEVAMDTMEVDKSNDGRFRAFNLSRSVLVFADSLPALGRALAEREGA